MKLTTREEINLIVNELEKIKEEAITKEVNLVIEKSRIEIINILYGYLAALQNQSDFRFELEDVVIEQKYDENKILVIADVLHDSKIEDCHFNVKYKFSVRRYDVNNLHKSEFIKQFLKVLESTFMFDTLLE